MSFNFHGFGTVLIQIFTRWPLGLKVQIFHQIFYAPWPDRKSASNWIFFKKLTASVLLLLAANGESSADAPPLSSRKKNKLRTCNAACCCRLFPSAAESCFSVEFKPRFRPDHVWVISTKNYIKVLLHWKSDTHFQDEVAICTGGIDLLLFNGRQFIL